jgi:tetratricopeptide (TPR) repeat protein
LSFTRNLSFLLLGAPLLGGMAIAAEEPAPKTPPPQKVEAPAQEPKQTTVDSQLARDVAYWQETMAETPGDVTVRLALGNAYALNNRFEEAVQEYTAVLKDYPEYKSAWNNLGSAYRALGKKSRALDAYRKAVKIDPRYALAYYNIGVVYDAAGQYEKALEYYADAVKIDPTLLDPKKNPQVVKNGNVFAVLLHNYVESSDHVALPLEPAFPAPEH